MNRWLQYKIIRSVDARRNNPLESNYDFTKRILLPILTRLCVEHTLVLNYLKPQEKDPDERDYMYFRVEAADEVHSRIEAELESLRLAGTIAGLQKVEWSPQADALARVREAMANLRKGGAVDPWLLADGAAVPIVRDLDKWIERGMWARRAEEQMAADLATMFAMAGDWSREFIERFDARPREGYLLSLMLHLLLNGLACSGPTHGDEAAIRLTPLI